MSIELITYTGQTVSPMHDAIMREMMTGDGGIIHGCEVTASGNELYITAGYGAIKGRLFKITSTTLTVTLASGSTLYGRLFVKLDLSNTSTPITIETDVDSTPYELTQEDDVNFTDGVYEIGLASFNVSTTGIEDLVEDYKRINSIADLIYPVGSIYMSVNSTNPSRLFGGTWTTIGGRFLIGQSSKYPAGELAGSATKTIAIANLPAHTHTIAAHTHDATIGENGEHRHRLYKEKLAAAGTSRFTVSSAEGAQGDYTQYEGNHSHGIMISSAGGGNAGSTGGGEALNIMPPYFAVYMWRRTA